MKNIIIQKFKLVPSIMRTLQTSERNSFAAVIK